MQRYHQRDLLDVLLDAAIQPNFQANADLQVRYNRKRFAQAMASLRSRNIFLYTEGSRPTTNVNSTTTIYTQPAGVPLIVLGYSDNFRYGAVQTPGGGGETIFPQMHRVRIVGAKESSLVGEWVSAQAGTSGQPRYTETLLPAPIYLEAQDQIAVDLGYDTAEVDAASFIAPNAFTFFAVKVKDKLTAEEMAVVDDVKAFIAANPFQRSVFMNCAQLAPTDGSGGVTRGLLVVGLSGGGMAGETRQCNTPPADVPLLISGVGTTLRASKLLITDTSDGSSFSLNRFMQSSAFNMPDFEPGSGSGSNCVVGAPIWTPYYPFKVPHLLRRGAQLHAEVVNGGTTSDGVPTVESGVINQLIFQGMTV